MKNLTLLAILFALNLIPKFSHAESYTNHYDYKNFDKVQIEHVNGEVEIQLGKTYSIIVFFSDDDTTHLKITKSEDKLLIALNSTILNTAQTKRIVKIKITMPEISKLYNFSNADVSVKYFTGRYLGIENMGNGNVSASGKLVDFIEIKNNGNGNLETKNIISKKVEISKTGNGDVNIRTDSTFTVRMAGNGDVSNYGKGKAVLLNQSGTGKVVYIN